MNHKPYINRRTSHSAGFTLIELMISIAIALMLMVGVGGVFRVASDTIGVGQAIASMGRDGRATLSTMNEDFENFATDGPVLIIQSRPQIGFVDSNSYQANTSLGTFDPTQSGTAMNISQALDNNQVHRMDVLAFCTRCKYTRKASALGPADQTSSAEAFVWWGHLSMLDNTYGTYWGPAEGDNSGSGGGFYLAPPSENPNNFYGAGQWTLGRVCILLRPDAATADPAGGYFPSGNATGSTLNPSTNTLLAPLQGGTTAIVNGNQSGIPIESGVLDFAQTDIRTFRDAVIQQANYSAQQSYGYISWDMFLGGMPEPSAPAGAPYAPKYAYTVTNGGAQYPWTKRQFNARNWVRKALVSTPGAANETVGNQYTAFDQISQMSAAVLPGCTQFIVEYAGDYLNQINDPGRADDGQIVSIWGNNGEMGGGYAGGAWEQPQPGPTDGKLDFIVDADGSHRIRWYGFPRDVAGDSNTNLRDGRIPLPSQPTTAPPTTLPTSQLPTDVVPLRDVLQCVPQNALNATAHPNGAWENIHAPFEKVTVLGGGCWDCFAYRGPDYVSAMSGYGHINPYTCVWGPNDRLPWLIRVTIEVHDPNNRVQGGQTYEYIFALPH